MVCRKEDKKSGLDTIPAINIKYVMCTVLLTAGIVFCARQNHQLKNELRQLELQFSYTIQAYCSSSKVRIEKNGNLKAPQK